MLPRGALMSIRPADLPIPRFREIEPIRRVDPEPGADGSTERPDPQDAAQDGANEQRERPGQPAVDMELSDEYRADHPVQPADGIDVIEKRVAEAPATLDIQA